jgi:rsbT co-antagonist protein RsbR
LHELKKPEFTLSLSDSEIQTRKRWLELSTTDEAFIKKELDPVLQARVDFLMDKMYEHFLSFEETRSFFPDTKTLERAKSAQGEYFRRLTQGSYDSRYVQERLSIGQTHQRIDLDPKWYLGAYNNALSHLIPVLLESFEAEGEKQSKAVVALLKVIFFDVGLAIERTLHPETPRRH